MSILVNCYVSNKTNPAISYNSNENQVSDTYTSRKIMNGRIATVPLLPKISNNILLSIIITNWLLLSFLAANERVRIVFSGDTDIAGEQLEICCIVNC